MDTQSHQYVVLWRYRHSSPFGIVMIEMFAAVGDLPPLLFTVHIFTQRCCPKSVFILIFDTSDDVWVVVEPLVISIVYSLNAVHTGLAGSYKHVCCKGLNINLVRI